MGFGQLDLCHVSDWFDFCGDAGRSPSLEVPQLQRSQISHPRDGGMNHPEFQSLCCKFYSVYIYIYIHNYIYIHTYYISRFLLYTS